MRIMKRFARDDSRRNTLVALHWKLLFRTIVSCNYYNCCIKKNESILAIGDNIRTDIRGANRMKFDSLFITSGIHKKEFLNLSVENYDKVLSKYKTKTNYYQERLNW